MPSNADAIRNTRSARHPAKPGFSFLLLLGIGLLVGLLILTLLLFHAANARLLTKMHPLPMSALAAYAGKNQRIMAQGTTVESAGLPLPDGEKLAFERVIVGHYEYAHTNGHPSYLKIDDDEICPEDLILTDGKTRIAVKSSDIDEAYLSQVAEGVGDRPENVVRLLGPPFATARNMMDTRTKTRVFAFVPGQKVTFVGAIRSENGMLRLVASPDLTLIVTALEPDRLVEKAQTDSELLIVFWTFLLMMAVPLACIIFPWSYLSHRTFSKLTGGEKLRLLLAPLFLVVALAAPFYV